MMKAICLITLSSFLVACHVTSSVAQIDCTGLSDGVQGHGCRSYTNCSGGVGEIVDCPETFAFNWRTGACEPWDEVPPPCGSRDANCTYQADGRYAVLSWNCTYYYTCIGGLFYGANPCNNPPDQGDLVFDELNQICNWKASVAPPCGTLSAAGSNGAESNRKRRR